MKTSTFPPIPSGLNLGDIANVKIGDEVTVWHTHTGERVLAPYVSKILSIDSNGLARAVHGHFYLKFKGAAPYAMDLGWFYYSVNPEHIAAAKKLITEAQEKAQHKAEAREALMRKVRPIGEALGDGTRQDDDGKAFDDYTVAENLADKLTPEQLDTLAGWLGINNKTA